LRDKALDKHTFSFADLLVGDAVRVRAFVDTNGDVVAVKLERLQKPLANDILQGPMDTKDPTTTSLTIIGIMVQGSPTTVWRLADKTTPPAAAWFDATAVGTIVRAQGAEGSGGASLDATEVQVQVGDD
jgi:hypothetical protein